MKVLMLTSLTMALYSIYRYSTANGAEFIEWFIGYIIFLVAFGFFKKEIRFNKIVGKLINTVNIDTASGQENNKEI